MFLKYNNDSNLFDICIYIHLTKKVHLKYTLIIQNNVYFSLGKYRPFYE